MQKLTIKKILFNNFYCDLLCSNNYYSLFLYCNDIKNHSLDPTQPQYMCTPVYPASNLNHFIQPFTSEMHVLCLFSPLYLALFWDLHYFYTTNYLEKEAKGTDLSSLKRRNPFIILVRIFSFLKTLVSFWLYLHHILQAVSLYFNFTYFYLLHSTYMRSCNIFNIA